MLRRVMLTAAAVSFLSGAATRADGLPQPNSHTSAAEATASTTPAYADGRRDRLAWVDWFNALAIGSYRDGAFWWTREHSKEQPRGCVSRSGNVEWEMGCKAAQQRLAVTDIRLKAEPAYSLGWSSQTTSDIPPEAITLSPAERIASSASPYADGLRDRQAWENWLRGLPSGSYLDGALWWSDERIKRQHGACVSPTGDNQWEEGCRAARRRLAVVDVRRNTEAAYRSGWSSGAERLERR